ncbi:MAG TPA: lysozyme inhibitor LprI family protein [Deferrisomatales bacterium]|nr:lysozyme inhibitor LprI family protein [Deferrisomatales bacterium]
MWKGALLVAVLWLAGTAGPFAATDPVAGDDLLCEDSLGRAEAVLDALYAEAESSMGSLNRARFRRAHTDWLRFRDSDCAFAESGAPGRKCCVQRQTEARTDTLRLYLAQFRPLEFRTWEDPIRTPEKQALLKWVTGRGHAYAAPVLPDQILRVGDSQFLLAFSSTRSDARGLEYVNLGRRVESKVLEGGPKLLRVLADTSEARHVVVMSDSIDRRTLWRELYTVRLNEEAGRMTVEKQRLALFREDAGSGRCDLHSAEFLKMDKAVVPGEVRFADDNGDGVTDISLIETEIDCRTQEETRRPRTFLAGEAGFREAAR